MAVLLIMVKVLLTASPVATWCKLRVAPPRLMALAVCKFDAVVAVNTPTL